MYIILIFIGFFLVILNWKAIRKEKTSFKSAFDTASASVEEVDLMLLELRREFAETITELQREILDLKDIIDKGTLIKREDIISQDANVDIKNEMNSIEKLDYDEEKNYNSSAQRLEISYNKEDSGIITKSLLEKSEANIKSELHKDFVLDVESNDTLSSNTLKIEDIKNLFNEGLTLDEIAARLNIGKGEVLLIKELYLK
ncbi:hypothetical protein J2Z44_001581 [Clostridium punense]|uniref:Helix-turn-helix domain-containing protein n=1 Tax=Clostridium punense TaxID=1054297 RepID=A0ABS4K1X6_9CLOT|nr:MULTISPECIES: hypothetical protein [Clostridium]EQB87787.1 hypothetical protein M918_07435 [Clostridium sp. BL8]MBP2021785.1 hypothetical protein [Clostridium punense]